MRQKNIAKDGQVGMRGKSQAYISISYVWAKNDVGRQRNKRPVGLTSKTCQWLWKIDE